MPHLEGAVTQSLLLTHRLRFSQYQRRTTGIDTFLVLFLLSFRMACLGAEEQAFEAKLRLLQIDGLQQLEQAPGALQRHRLLIQDHAGAWHGSRSLQVTNPGNGVREHDGQVLWTWESKSEVGWLLPFNLGDFEPRERGKQRSPIRVPRFFRRAPADAAVQSEVEG